MKETGLMFKAPLVRAILSGQKTQTRRILKNQRSYDLDKCPMGQPGDRIYVRETWAEVARHHPLTDEDLPMRQDGRIVVYEADPDWEDARGFLCADGCIRWAKPDRWSPSIHMRKTDARIWLEITGVRVERLQDISEADCWREGVDDGKYHGLDRAYARAFSELWESTGGDWAANPWVWVIDFKQIPKPATPKEPE